MERVDLHEKIPKNNDTTRFLLPSLGFKVELSMFVLNRMGFINCYLEDKNHYLKYDNSLTLIFNPPISSLHNWHKFQDYYSKLSNYVDTWDIDWGVVGVAFTLQPKWINFIHYFKNGKYSKMNIKNYSDLFIKRNSYGIITDVPKEYYIIIKDNKYRLEKEAKLGLADNSLINKELYDKPRDLFFDYKQYL